MKGTFDTSGLENLYRSYCVGCTDDVTCTRDETFAIRTPQRRLVHLQVRGWRSD